MFSLVLIHYRVKLMHAKLMCRETEPSESSAPSPSPYLPLAAKLGIVCRALVQGLLLGALDIAYSQNDPGTCICLPTCSRGFVRIGYFSIWSCFTLLTLLRTNCFGMMVCVDVLHSSDPSGVLYPRDVISDEGLVRLYSPS